jgi:SAM-dependent methyltransferase
MEAIEAHDRQRMLPAQVHRALIASLVERLQKHQPCLDAGAGTGMITSPLAQKGIRVTALDASPRMLEVFRTRAGEEDVMIPLVLGDIQHMPFPDATFGSALVANVFHLVPDWEQALSELRRVLRAERRLLVNLGGAGTLPSDLAWLERTFHDLITPGEPVNSETGGTRDAQSFDELAIRLGLQPCPPLEVAYAGTATPESILSRLERNVFARQQGIAKETVQRAAAKARAMAIREIGALDREYERVQRIVYRCFA